MAKAMSLENELAVVVHEAGHSMTTPRSLKIARAVLAAGEWRPHPPAARAAGVSTVTVTAGEVEAWTTGDNDILESDLLTKLRLVQEEISAGRKDRGEVLVIITK